MAWNKNVNTKMACKGVVANLIKTGVAISGSVFFAACGDDGGSKSSGAEDAPVREVSTIYDLGACTPDREGDTVYVTAQSIDYLCSGNNWLDITTLPENPDPAQSSSSVVPGNDPESSSSTVDDPLNGGSSSSARTSYIEVTTREQLGTCDASLIGLRALVLADSSYFTCKANGWAKDDTYLGYDIVPTKEDLPQCHAGNTKQRVLVKKDSVFFKCDSVKWVPETADGYIVKNASILGAAQKGPFNFNSPLQLREALLRNDSLIYSGRKYVDEISSNKGDFVIPKVNLVYPYAVLEVRGLWRNEVSGEYSKDSMTLRALTDLTSRTEVNINLLTHLEYDRAVQLVNKGYSVFAAKKQADYEIMTAFGFATSVEYSEDLKTFVPSTSKNYADNATLMAISLLFIGDRSEAEIQNAINSFKSDLAEDGEWDNGQMKADMADWAEAFDGGSVRANVKSWNILDIPDYENYLTIYWNNAYELGGCSATRSGVIAQNNNSKSKNYNVHYICRVTSWQKATDFEKDTYEWADGEVGEVKKGNVTATYYVFENGKWTVAKNETALGLCTASRNGEVGKIDTTYFICDNKNWRKATVLEYDTYQFGAGNDGEVRIGKVNEDKYYVFENGAWRASASEIENNLGACVISREGVVGKSGSTYYICKSKSWVTATALEYDTYGWTAGTEGEVKAGSVNAKNYYVYEEGSWRASTSEIENNLGACVTSREGVVGKSGSTYYICKAKSWVAATALEYDTYGWAAGTEGEVKAGSVNITNHYVYADGTWRTSANEIEYDLGACVTSREGVIGKSDNTHYICKSKSWVAATALEYDTYGWTAGTEEEIREGNVNQSKYYIYTSGHWAETTIGEDLGVCNSLKNGYVGLSGRAYYICKSNTWRTATVLEYDTYGKTCLTDGSVVNGEVVAANKYVCDTDSFRTAQKIEISLDKGCVSYTEGLEIRKHLPTAQDSVYSCSSSLWKATLEFVGEYGTLVDSRDGNIYKTVVIGTQTWMAENLNYSDSVFYSSMQTRNRCDYNLDSCVKYGRFYTWSAAMDTAGTFSANAINCGYGKKCSPTYPVRGICPEGWHLPSYEEWRNLYSTMGKSRYSMQAKGFDQWPDATDAYGFSALPSNGNSYSATFWSATDDVGIGAWCWHIHLNGAGLSGYDGAGHKTNMHSIRCLQD